MLNALRTSNVVVVPLYPTLPPSLSAGLYDIGKLGKHTGVSYVF